MTLIINGTQVNIQAAILGYTHVDSYQHFYSIEQNFGGSDLDDNFANYTINNPCDSNPCQNGGTCEVGLTGRYVCTCPDYITGNL